MTFDAMQKRIANYFSAKVREHGETAAGVGWNSHESQYLRFAQLSKILPQAAESFSLIDFGCGYGALIEALAARGVPFHYQGYDISEEMIARARRRYPKYRFTAEIGALEPANFTVASGIFNVKMDTPVEEWRAYVLSTLDIFDRLSAQGFSFNLLTNYSDRDYMRDDLYYPEPSHLFDYCKRRYSRQVALLHDYGLYEFTILVRKGTESTPTPPAY